MKKKILILGILLSVLALVCAFFLSPSKARAGLLDSLNFGGGGGTVTTLDQFTGTSSPATAITQRTYGKSFRLSGQGTGCATFSSNGTLTSTGVACGSGGGGGSSFAFPFTATTYGGQSVNATSTGLLFTGSPLGIIASSTFATNASTTNLSIGILSGAITGNSGAISATTLILDQILVGNGSNTFRAATANTALGPVFTDASNNIVNFALIPTMSSTSEVSTFNLPEGTLMTATSTPSNLLTLRVADGSTAGGIIVNPWDFYPSTNNVNYSRGNVGIGSSTPSKALSVSGDASFDRGGTTGASLTRTVTIQGTSRVPLTFANLDFANYDNNNAATDYVGARISATNSNGIDDGDLRFFTASSATTLNTAASLTIAGISNPGNISFPYGSTTMISATTASTTNLTVSSAGGSAGCATFSATGVISNTGSACGTGSGGTFPFTPTTNYNTSVNATTTPIWLQGTPISLMASTTIQASTLIVDPSTTSGTTTFKTKSSGTAIAGKVVFGDDPGLIPTAGFNHVVFNKDGANNFLAIGSHNSNSTVTAGLNTYSSRGTSAAPTASQADDPIFSIQGQGYGATAYASAVAVRGFPSQNWTDSAQGSYLTFETKLNNASTRAERFRVDSSGNLAIGSTTGSSLLSVQGSGYITSNLFVGGNITSTSSVASIFPYASTTALTVSGSTYNLNGNYFAGATTQIGTNKGYLASYNLSGAEVGGEFQNTNSAGYEGFNFYNDSGTLVSSLAHSNSGTGFLGNSIWFGSRNSEPLYLMTNTTVGLTMDSNQNVGIGSTSPATKLSVSGDGFFDRNTNTNGLNRTLTIQGAQRNPTVTYANISFANYDVNSSASDYTGAKISSVNTNGADDGDLQFFTASSALTLNANPSFVVAGISSPGTVGVGTTTPSASFAITGAVTKNPFYISTTTPTVASSTLFMIDQAGWVHYGGGTPTLSSCGTSPTLGPNSTDQTGTITFGATASGCTLTFSTAPATAPHCVVTPRAISLVNAYTVAPSVTGIVLTQAASGGTLWDYFCPLGH